MVSKIELINTINDRGGKLISKYINKKTKVKIKCNYGHVWKATPANLNAKYKKSWCPFCSRYNNPNRRKGIKCISKR